MINVDLILVSTDQESSSDPRSRVRQTSLDRDWMRSGTDHVIAQSNASPDERGDGDGNPRSDFEGSPN
jgi:hypothetical protein